ncbi:rhomboid family intramembrane serine protease [Sanyastnella coralliicola]|uniref:rhomboid family intramembrane serine protease n=1 Tax=Sanyastnella coralliicola TaxID=3069118 RepID=UPI0027B9A91E|nr:rhomboid family intramembrane serine protease [Longitalea sp. SCSIO 12813]
MLQPTTPVVRNLLILNVLFFLGTSVAGSMFEVHLTYLLGAFYPASDWFRPWQIVTHMFMHGGPLHIFFNMFALYMFGTTLERVWGSKRFLIYYMVCGLGAFFLHEAVNAYQVFQATGELMPVMTNANAGDLAGIYNIPMVGASGAVYGLLLAFGVLFPNTRLMLLFPPIPIKAKWLVFGLGIMEIYLVTLDSASDNIAHFAHLGGMLFGYLLLKKWQRDTTTFY